MRATMLNVVAAIVLALVGCRKKSGIRDELRKVDIALRIADNCTPVAEKP